MTNAFMASAARSKKEQLDIQKPHAKGEGLKVLNIRIPAELHYKANLHRLETGENVTQLVVRLLREELE